MFIDDTGSPGLPVASQSLHPERKTWVAVVVPAEQIAEVIEQLPQAIQGLREATGATEFHFADIYGGKGPFEGVDLQKRLGIFAFMAHIFNVYNFPIFVQTFDPGTLANLNLKGRLPDKVGPFDITNQEDAALLFLLIRIRWYIEELEKDHHPTVACVFADEGYKKHGTALCLPTWEDVFRDGLVWFANSTAIPPIQLADFAAFTLNRTQLLLAKDKLSPLDVSLLEILSQVVFNYQNTEKRQFSLEELGNGSYKILK